MEIIRQTITTDLSADVAQVLYRHLRGLSELRQLEVLTEILTASTDIEERLAEMTYAAWIYMCERDLWSFKYESLDQYRQLISYRDTIRPIIARYKVSDRAKATSLHTIEEYWKEPVAQTIPLAIAPKLWSKHLLFLLATLSKRKCKEDAVTLLRESIKQRPHRSRHANNLIASDVQRVLKKCPGFKRYRARTALENAKRAREKPRDAELPAKILVDSHIDPQSSNNSDHTNLIASTTLPGVTTSTIGTSPCVANASLIFQDDAELQGCGCAPICLPLMVLLSLNVPNIRETLVIELLKWGQNVSWSNFCLEHLQHLAFYRFGEVTIIWSQDELIRNLDGFLLSLVFDDIAWSQVPTPPSFSMI